MWEAAPHSVYRHQQDCGHVLPFGPPFTNTPIAIPMKHSDVVRHIKASGYEVAELHCAGGGRAAVCPMAGRVISLRFPGLDENIFWSSADLDNHAALRKGPWELTGGPGGERLWFAP